MYKTWIVISCLLIYSNQSTKPLKILAIGDSITQGGKKSQAEYTYRLPLQRLLHAKGIAFDFIGSQRRGLDSTVTWPDVAPGIPFDPEHEGYYGHKTAKVVGKVKEAFPQYTSVPDIVLIHLGTNDQKSANFESEIGAPLEELITFIRQKNPEAIFLVGHLNFNGGGAAKEIRAVVETLALRLNTSKSAVRTVHHYQNWNEDPNDLYTDTYDWAHPNLKGQEKMALKWFEAMQPFLPAGQR